MAHATWFGSHVGHRCFARYLYRIANDSLFQKHNDDPDAAWNDTKWVKLESAKITYHSEDKVIVEFPEGNGFVTRWLGLIPY